MGIQKKSPDITTFGSKVCLYNTRPDSRNLEPLTVFVTCLFRPTNNKPSIFRRIRLVTRKFTTTPSTMRGTRPRRRGAVRPLSNAQVSQRMTALERRLTGHKTVPQNNPPAYVALPWNSFTYEKTQIAGAAGADQVTTIAEIQVQLFARCGLQGQPNPAKVSVKVQSAQVWGSAGSTLMAPEISTKFFELSGESPTSQSIRSQQRDVGTLSMPAKTGYAFPVSDRKEIAGDQPTLKVVEAVAIYEGMYMTTRVQILWQAEPQ